MSDKATEEGRRLRREGHLEDAVNVLEKALQSSQTDRLSIMQELAEALAREGAWARAMDLLERALKIVDVNSPRRLDFMERKAWVLFRSGRLAEARTLAEELLGTTGPSLRAAVHGTLGGIAWQEGKIIEAIAHVQQSAQLYEESGDVFGSANALTNAGVLRYTQGLWQEAAESFRSSERLRGQLDLVAGRAANLLNLGLLAMSIGNHDDARRSFEHSVEISRAAGEKYDAARARIALAHLALLEHRIDEADALVESVLAQPEFISEDDIVQASWLKALVECDRGASARGVELATRARAIAQGANLVESEADCCRALAIACFRNDRPIEAEKALLESIDLAARIGDPYRRGLALLELGVVYGSSAAGVTQSHGEARRAIDEAEQIFKLLGAGYDLDRLAVIRQSLGG